VSSRSRRALLGLALGIAAFAVWPASALAAGETLSVSPSSTQAGSNPNITATLQFAPGDTPNIVTLSLAPGLLANLNANPSCLASAQLTAACQIGTSSTTTDASPTPVSGSMYLVPPHPGDAAGIDIVTTGSSTPQYVGVSLNPSVPGGLNMTTQFPNIGGGVHITGFAATINSTLNGQPFTRLPSSCSPANNAMTVTYYSGASGSASQTFAATGCGALPYAPNLTAAITSDTHGGATIVSTLTQAAGESASKSISLTFPSGLKPNLAADIACLGATPCTVGTATASSPLVPSAALANGTVTLGAPASAPTITIAFPAPFALTITGTIGLTNNSVTFQNVPDIPLTNLTLNITGPNGQKAFTTDCKPASVTGTFTAQSGATHGVTAPIRFTGCAGKPTATGFVSGLASGHPELKFRITHGSNAPNISSVAISLPRGLSFSRSAFVRHRTCTVKNGKKKCTTTTLIKGLGITFGRARFVALRHGKLVIILKRQVRRLSLSISGPLVTESRGLQTAVKRHRSHRLQFTLKITDAKRTATTLFLRLRPH
jgi:hypothetical protein